MVANGHSDKMSVSEVISLPGLSMTMNLSFVEEKRQ